MAGKGLPMPAPNYGKDEHNYKRALLVKEFGLATVMAAEFSAVLDVFVKLGILSMGEYLDMVGYRCQMVDRARQDQAQQQAGR